MWFINDLYCKGLTGYTEKGYEDVHCFYFIIFCSLDDISPNQIKKNISIKHQTISNGSLSNFETLNSISFEKSDIRDFWSTLRNPLSVLLWSQSMTDTPDCTACRTSW